MNAFRVTFLSVILTFSIPIFSQPERGGGPPPWAPAHGYRAKTQHVYFPSLNIYFDVHRNLYYFLSGNSWVISHNLPPAIPLPLLRRTPMVELSVVTPTPYYYNEQHRVKYKTPNSLPRPKGPVVYPPHPSNTGPKPGGASPKPGSASPKPGGASPKPGSASPKPGSGNPKSGSGNPKSGGGNPKSGGGNPKSGGGKK